MAVLNENEQLVKTCFPSAEAIEISKGWMIIIFENGHFRGISSFFPSREDAFANVAIGLKNRVLQEFSR
ncbi:Uncharacterised protein [uncultured archaeon]|nr:Uncharacterised protein [uncultured archaeon]